MPETGPHATHYAANGMVCSVDHVASGAGLSVLQAGGSAADAAIATSAVLAVTTPHMCGMGGDLFALVHDGSRRPAVLNASGRAGSGADPEQLRSEGATEMPFRRDIRSVPVPGCVDGWVTLHDRYGRLALADVLEPARSLAADGFAVSAMLSAMLPLVAEVAGTDDLFDGHAATPGERRRRPGVARSLESIAKQGRAGFYEGEFGEGLIAMGSGEYTEADLRRPLADWAEPICVSAFGHDLWTVPPNSQGYLTLSSAWIADALDLPRDPADAVWPHLLVEAARQAGHDRSTVLHEKADGEALLSPERLSPRRDAIDRSRVSPLVMQTGGGDTIYLCAADAHGMGVSLIQSNAADFGVHLVESRTGTFLHNRGIGFSLKPGDPAEYGPGRRPPSTLSPALITRPDGSLRTLVGTMGGDSQPQVILQLMVRLLHAGQRPGEAVRAPRWVLANHGSAIGFSTWNELDSLGVDVEGDAPRGWLDGLRARGHAVRERRPLDHGFGHAHVIETDGSTWAGSADPRAGAGAALGY